MALFAGCSTPGLAEALASSDRYQSATAAGFEMEVVVEATPEGEPHFAPCRGQIELLFTNTNSKRPTRAVLNRSGHVTGALAEGDYELAVSVDGMRLGLEGRIGLVPLREGRQVLGVLSIRLFDLAPGTFEEQAVHAERLRHLHGLRAVDFVHSPARGLLLFDAVLGSPP